MNESPGLIMMTAVLGLAVMISAIACVHSKHQSRKLFVELQQLTSVRDEMQVNWGRLQIEQSTWSAHARVEGLARKQMKMRSPDPADIRLVRQ
ncbi:MAG: cell division protein FtsL [Gammaproteobacteria bacterium]|jgi:cell division protein FtsL|nr:cell division protein FtsL [Gammaproteobacteria bacterium]